MPVYIELRNERGQVLAQRLGEGAIERLIPPIDDRSSEILRFVDPYGDTVFNGLQAAALVAELSLLVTNLDNADERVAIEAVTELAERCRSELHTYLWFIGD